MLGVRVIISVPKSMVFFQIDNSYSYSLWCNLLFSNTFMRAMRRMYSLCFHISFCDWEILRRSKYYGKEKKFHILSRRCSYDFFLCVIIKQTQQKWIIGISMRNWTPQRWNKIFVQHEKPRINFINFHYCFDFVIVLTRLIFTLKKKFTRPRSSPISSFFD